jgi:hypothetical protein
MDNDQRMSNYETQKGIAYLDSDTRLIKLTGPQRKRLRHKKGSGTHAHAPDVFVDDKHKDVRTTHCDICSQPASAPVLGQGA